MKDIQQNVSLLNQTQMIENNPSTDITTSPEELTSIYTTSNSIIENPNSSEKEISGAKALINDVASNPNTPEETLQEIYINYPDARESIQSNPIIDMLIFAKPNTISDWVNDYDLSKASDNAKLNIAESPHTDIEIEHDILMKLAAETKNSEILDKLSDSYNLVKREVASNSAISGKTLNKLLNDSDEMIINEAVINRQKNPGVKEKLSEYLENNPDKTRDMDLRWVRGIIPTAKNIIKKSHDIASSDLIAAIHTDKYMVSINKRRETISVHLLEANKKIAIYDYTSEQAIMANPSPEDKENWKLLKNEYANKLNRETIKENNNVIEAPTKKGISI